jgi:hypothetical protein
VAAQARRELGTDIEVVGAPYGRFEVLEGGPLAALGVLPSARNVIDAVRTALGDSAGLVR